MNFVSIGQQPSRLGVVDDAFGADGAEMSHCAKRSSKSKIKVLTYRTRARAICRYRRAQAQAHRQRAVTL